MKIIALVAALAACVRADPVIPATYSGSGGLNTAAQASGRYMGTASGIYQGNEQLNDPNYMAALKNTKDWGILTATNIMKPDALHPQQNRFSFDTADKFVAFAKQQGMKVRGHTLVWHGQVPGWLEYGQWTKDTLLAALTDHITGIMTHFGDDIYAWDVVNEIVGDDGSYRKSFWYNICGPDYIAHAFKVANDVKQRLGLKVKLYYNDYNLEVSAWSKYRFALNMVKNLLAQGIKVDGVGLQGHLTVGSVPSNLPSVLQSFADLGVDVAFTELDIGTDKPPSTAKQQQQKKDYATVAAACKSVSRCVGLTVWDFIDQYSWVEKANTGFATPFIQPNGKGSTVVRKLAYDGIIEGFGGGSDVPPVTVTPGPGTKTPSPPVTTQPPSTTKPPSPGGAPLYGQCGGQGWTGPTTCAQGTCKKLNDYYFQCVQ